MASEMQCLVLCPPSAVHREWCFRFVNDETLLTFVCWQANRPEISEEGRMLTHKKL